MDEPLLLKGTSTLPTITLASLTPFDWILLAILLLSTLAAFQRGIIKVLFSIGGLILGIVVASWNYLSLAERLRPVVSNFPVAQVVAFLAILLAIMIGFSFAARLLRKVVSTVGLGIFDRLFGAAFGFLRGLLLGIAVMMAAAAFTPKASWLQQSQLVPWFLSGAHTMSFLVPERFEQQVSTGADHLLKQTPELFRPHTLTQPM